MDSSPALATVTTFGLGKNIIFEWFDRLGMPVPNFGAKNSKTSSSSVERVLLRWLFVPTPENLPRYTPRTTSKQHVRFKVVVKCLKLLGEAFGYTKNTKGFKLLPPYIRF